MTTHSWFTSELKDAFFPLKTNKNSGYDYISFNIIK